MQIGLARHLQALCKSLKFLQTVVHPAGQSRRCLGSSAAPCDACHATSLLSSTTSLRKPGPSSCAGGRCGQGAVESNRNLLKPGLRAGSFINKHLKQLPFDAWQPLDLRDRWRRGAGGQVSPRSLTWVQQSLQPDDVWHSADSPRGDRRDLSAPAKPARSKGCKSLTTKT